MPAVYTARCRRDITSQVIEYCTAKFYRGPDHTQGGTLMNIDLTTLSTHHRGTLAELLGIRFIEASPERVVAEILFRDALTTVGGSLHGGTLMAFADTVGAAATMLNLSADANTTTIESKTNFFAAGRSGTIRAETTPLHRGKRTMVWQTRITDESGRLLSLTIQTQMVLEPRRPA